MKTFFAVIAVVAALVLGTQWDAPIGRAGRNFVADKAETLRPLATLEAGNTTAAWVPDVAPLWPPVEFWGGNATNGVQPVAATTGGGATIVTLTVTGATPTELTIKFAGQPTAQAQPAAAPVVMTAASAAPICVAPAVPSAPVPQHTTMRAGGGARGQSRPAETGCRQ